MSIEAGGFNPLACTQVLYIGANMDTGVHAANVIVNVTGKGILRFIRCGTSNAFNITLQLDGGTIISLNMDQMGGREFFAFDIVFKQSLKVCNDAWPSQIDVGYALL